MQKHLQRKEGGFTIIEVLIVLAIAGLILLIVFLAVPSLRRNSRNTTAKNDAQNVAGGISEYQGANDGKLPTGVSGIGTINYTGATGTNATDIRVQGTTVVSTVTAVPTSLPTGQIRVMLQSKCNGDTAVTTNSRSAAVFYSIETSAAAPVVKCTDI
jgi:prepilin-type N-terminal cleavage/methylation domain-containing protein